MTRTSSTSTRHFGDFLRAWMHAVWGQADLSRDLVADQAAAPQMQGAALGSWERVISLGRTYLIDRAVALLATAS